jgi:2-C-methyl-D-erythritol 4-phosphate cytidylyltransferase/2-C-methyl-D-erythritol 2,4-cyclodiphosphate synthase
MTVAALIVAAGKSLRFGGEVPKIYQPLCGVPVLAHSIKVLLESALIDHVCVVIHPSHNALYQAVANRFASHPMAPKLMLPVFGGPERLDSVHNGLEALATLAPKNVLIHDGARPNLRPALITRIVEALKTHQGAISALPIYDAVKQVENHTIIATANRDHLRTVQTPQGFDFATLVGLYRDPNIAGGIDDALLCEQAGIAVVTVTGQRDNYKVTTQEDLIMLEQCMQGDYHVGTGYDAHRFKPAKGPDPYVILGGIRVPHTHTLEAHSDGDLLLHALVDAMLGTIAGGDIGMHFPPSDPQWKDVDSSQFVTHALTLIQAKGGRIANVDLTLIGERPRIGNYREAICVSVASMLQISRERVNMKATTTERMGFTGREEGLAAQAVVGVYLPMEK